MLICSGLRPEVAAASRSAPIGVCVPTQMSSVPSPLNRAVALSGSICAWASMRRFIERLDDLAARCALGEVIVDIAVVARAHHRTVERVAIKLGELRAVGLAGLAGVPFRLEQCERFLGAPEAVGNHRDRVVELDHLLHAAPALDRRLVHALELAARHRAGIDRGIDHARNLRIDGELGGAVDLQRRIETRQRLADQLELIGRSDRRFLVELDLGGVGGERAVVERAPAGLVQNLAVGRLAFAGGTFQRCAAAAMRRTRALAPACSSICHEVRTPRLPAVTMSP